MAITGQDLLKRLKQNNTNKSTITGSDLLAAKKYGANSVNNDYISSYIKDTESYINNAKKQYEGVGWGNASEVYNTQSSTYDDLEKRRKTINSWLKLNQNKVANYDSLAKSLADLEKSTADVVGSFKSAKDYYSQWDTQEAYDAYKKTEDEKKAILEAPDFQEYSVKGEVMGKGYASGLNQLLGKAPKNTVANMRQDPKVLENYETAAKSSNGAAWGTTENIALNNIIYKAAKYMTDEEYGIYNYYFAKDEQDGTNLAEEYLSKIENALNYRQGSAEYEGIKDKPFLEMLFGVEAGLDQFVSGIGNLDNYFLGEEADLTSSTQYASGMIREDLGTFGKGLYDFTTTTSNMLPSILAGSMTNIIAPGAGTYVGAGLIGLSATGNAYAEMRNLGYNENQARGYATLVGASEATLSALFGGIKGIGGKLTNHAVSKFISGIDNGFARVAIKYGSEMLSEGLEESVQSVLEPMFKRLTTGDEFDVDWGEVAYSGLLGALSAGVLNAAPTTFEIAQTMAEGKNIKANEGVERLKKLGTSMSADSAAYKIANKIDENTGAYKIGLLLNEVGATLSEKNMSDIRTSLERKGVASKDAATIAKWMQKAVSGEYFTARQRAALENNDTLAQTLVDVVINPKSTIAQREGEVASLRELAQTKATPTKAEKSAPTAEETPEVTENAPIKEKASEGKISAPEPYAVLSSVTDNISEVIGKVGDKYKVRLNDGTELLEDAAEMSPNTERLFATAKDLGLNAESTNVFLKSYDGSMSAADYATAYAEAYRYGEYNFAESEMRSDGFSALLSESQRKIAYESGRIDRKYKTEAKQAEIKKTDKKQSKGKLHNTVAPTNERQKASLKALGVLAEALGIDIYTFESETNAEGKHIGKNGWYDPKDNSIHIDVYAGSQGHDTILFTAAHELTHMVRRWSPEKFKVFADFLMEKYGEQGKSVSELVRAQMTKAKENGRTLTFDEAYEELVADSCESFLADGDAIAKIAELKAKDKSLWEKIKDYLTKLIARIKAAYEGLEPDSEEGKFVASLLDSAEELRDLWVEAVVDASTAYNEGEIVSIDETSESVSPAFSERTWTQSDYVVHRDEMAKKISEALGVTVAKAKSYIDDINSIAKMIADDRVRLDYEASSFGSAFVSNVEYGGSFDYTTLCKKRRIYTGTFTEIQKRLKDTALSPDDILKIRNLLIEEGVEATCGLCYVEGSRANMGKFAKEFIRLYKRDNPNAWIPNMADVNTPDGVEQMRISHPEVYEQYEYFWNHYGKLKDSDPALFASQQKPKLYEARKEYKGEIIENFSKDTSVAKKNRNGGIRMQSFSDFEIVHLIDTMQVIMDMSTVGLAGQAYTKVPEFALAFGDTGLKINLSLIAKGVDENGKLIFDDREGMPHKTAFDIREKYSKNVGTIIVAFTDEQILAAMADERIDFIIPFHRSQWKKGQYGAMGLPNGTKDYTYQQNEKFIKPSYHEYRGRMVRDKASNYMPNEYWDFSKSGKENAEHYLNMCAEENKRPKFYKFLDYDGNGRYSLKEDGSTDGYWKLLIDFKMYDNDGVGSPQTAVAPTFNMDEATKMLDEYKGGHANYPVAQGVVDKFVREYEGVKYSDRSSDTVSNRTLLAEALEGITLNDIEKNKLADYKANAEKLDAAEARLKEVRAEIKEISFSKGTRDKARLSALKEEATKLTNRINIYDRRLINLEATSALKGVLDRAKEAHEEKVLKEYRKQIADARLAGRMAQGRIDAEVIRRKDEQIKAIREQRDQRDEQIKAIREKKNEQIKDIREQRDRKLDIAKAKAKADLDAYKERSKAREKEIAEAYRESRAANVEGRRKTEMRHKVKGTLKRLSKLLKGGKDRNVKEGMKDTVSTALALGEVLFNNEISNRDIVRLGVESVTEDESKLLNEYHDLLIKKDFNDERIKDIREGKIKPDSRPSLSECEEQNKKIEGRIATLNNKLSDVFIRERTRLNKTTVSTLIDLLATEYYDLQNSKDEFIKTAYVPELFTRLSDLKKDMNGVAARDMTLAQLEEVYKTFSMIEHVVTNSNKLWREGKRESLEERRNAIFGEIGAMQNVFDRDYAEWLGKTLGKINEWGWNNLRPVDAFELVGSESLTQLFWDVIDAQSVYARDIDEVKNAITSARQKYGYKKWDLSKTQSFEMPDGRTFKITLGEMMSIYAYSKREQADAHMREGGFQHAKGATYKDGKVVKLRGNEHLTYKIDDKLRFDIIRSLTKEQQAYVDDIQKLLTSWGEKGNEASRILYGIDLFNEEVYFPLKSSTDYLESMQTQLGQTATTASLAGSGMAKPTKPHANNPIILQAFDDVVLDHFDRMSKYHAYVVPIDNLRKILDSRGMDTNENMLSIKALIGEKLGDGAREYLLNYITDLNGSASVSGAKNPLENFFGKAKGASVAANLSVWVQQYFSIIRAFSEVNPRYFIPFINAQQTEGDLKVYGEMKKYAPIATIKEMGGFDVGSNRSIKDYIGYEEARVTKGKVAKKMTDAFGVGASLMDRLGWITIWKGIKKEVAASGKYKVGSEEYLQACGKRFEEVIVKTQVYDSVNARSGFMRSKHGAVKYLVSFMGEPTTIAGMAEVSVIKLKRALASKDKEAQKKATAKLAATMASIAASSIATSLAKSLVYAMRDDDEEENYIEKYAEAFGQAFRDDITLLNYLPIARDIVSLFEGHTIERPDMTLIEDLIDSFRSLTENFADEDTTSEEWWSDGFKLAGAIANMFGIPAKNIWRDVSGLGRTISNSGSGYKTDVAKNFIEGFTGEEIKKGDDLYTAIVSGDTKRVKHYKSTYKTESAYNSAVRKALRENDPRIKEAAEARYKGRDSEYSRIAKQIVREGNFTQDDVVAAINAEVMAIKKSETAKRTT